MNNSLTDEIELFSISEQLINKQNKREYFSDSSSDYSSDSSKEETPKIQTQVKSQSIEIVPSVFRRRKQMGDFLWERTEEFIKEYIIN